MALSGLTGCRGWPLFSGNDMASKTTDEWYDDGLSLLDSGFFDSAIECFDEVLSVDPQHARAWALKATALTGRKRYEEAIECFDKALEIEPENAQAREGKALRLAGLAREEEAARHQQEAGEITGSVEAPISPPNEPITTLYTVADGLVVDAVRGLAADEQEAWFVYGKYGGASRLTLRDQQLQTYTTDDGLVSDAVRCVVLGPKEVWFGTDRGLSRFDRETQEWTIHSQETGLKADVINDLAVEGELLWLGTESGLLVLDSLTGRSVICPGGPDPQGVDCLLVDGNRIWCGANREEGGLSVFDKTVETFEGIDVGPWVQGMQLLSRGENRLLWVAKRDGLTIVDSTTFEVEEIPLAAMLVTGIAVGVKSLLLSTARGVAVVDVRGEGPKSEVVVERSEVGRGHHVSAVCASRTREWMAIEGQGVLCLAHSP